MGNLESKTIHEVCFDDVICSQDYDHEDYLEVSNYSGGFAYQEKSLAGLQLSSFGFQMSCDLKDEEIDISMRFMSLVISNNEESSADSSDEVISYDEESSDDSSDETTTLYHYTNDKGAQGIDNDKVIKASTDQKNDAVFGKGVYLTSLDPYTYSKEEIIRNNYDDGRLVHRSSRFHDKADSAFEIKLPNDEKVISEYTEDVVRKKRVEILQSHLTK